VILLIVDVGTDVLLLHDGAQYVARILALLHDTTELNTVNNVCCVVQWYTDQAPDGGGIMMQRQFRQLIRAAHPFLNEVFPTEEVSVEHCSAVVTVAHVIKLGDDENPVFVRDLAYEKLQLCE